ncbi:MAG TPA: DUF2891 domain-containing protein [Gaiellaceae bacterium]|nr:DUF2891 domain-containing protein [Gaiellaceae bacterium]
MTLREHARDFADVILANTRREYPNDMHHRTTGPDDRPLPRELHPSFYGCFDWHSAVEMHWALLRLLRCVPDEIADAEARALLDEHLAAEALEVEAAYIADHPLFERPYGWGWALMLVNEVETWDDPDAARWSANLGPLADVLSARYLEWLAKATYPIRVGTHQSTAFSLARALPFASERARRGDDALEAAIRAAAERWYAADENAPAVWEPSGSDFLSPALVEAELMSALLPPEQFPAWLGRFLPGIVDERPATLFAPAVVSDDTDGYIGHLHGLNLSRAYSWLRLAEALGSDDARTPVMRAAANRHAEAAVPHVVGGDYVLEHWLAAYAVLLLS